MNETKKNYLYLQAFKKIIAAMGESKEQGNVHFKKQEYQEALDIYKNALDLAKQKEEDTEIEKIIARDLTFYDLKYSYLKILTILHSNLDKIS